MKYCLIALLLFTTPVLAEHPFDVDWNGEVDALTDGLLIQRYMFGFRGEALCKTAIAPGARRNCNEIQWYLDTRPVVCRNIARGLLCPPGTALIEMREDGQLKIWTSR